MNDDEIREMARNFRAMSDEEAQTFALILLEPEPMDYDAIDTLVFMAENVLMSSYDKDRRLAAFAGAIVRNGLMTVQDGDIKIDTISVHHRKSRPGTRPKILVRTHPVNGLHWFASIDTWTQGDR